MGPDSTVLIALAQVIWTDAPWPHQQSKRPGKTLLHPKPSNPGERLDQWASSQPDTVWRRLRIRDSDQGWVEVNYLSQRVWVIEGDRQKLWWFWFGKTPTNGPTTAPAPKPRAATTP